MRVYRATVIDRAASRAGEEDVKYESYVAVGTPWEMSFPEVQSKYLPSPFTDEDIHYYFTEDEWNKNLQADGTIENGEFTYWIGEEVK